MFCYSSHPPIWKTARSSFAGRGTCEICPALADGTPGGLESTPVTPPRMAFHEVDIWLVVLKHVVIFRNWWDEIKLIKQSYLPTEIYGMKIPIVYKLGGFLIQWPSFLSNLFPQGACRPDTPAWEVENTSLLGRNVWPMDFWCKNVTLAVWIATWKKVSFKHANLI